MLLNIRLTLPQSLTQKHSVQTKVITLRATYFCTHIITTNNKAGLLWRQCWNKLLISYKMIKPELQIRFHRDQRLQRTPVSCMQTFLIFAFSNFGETTKHTRVCIMPQTSCIYNSCRWWDSQIQPLSMTCHATIKKEASCNKAKGARESQAGK